MPAVAASLESPAPTVSPSASPPDSTVDPLPGPAVPPSESATVPPSISATVPSEALSTPATASPSAEPGTKGSAVTVEPVADPMGQPGFNPILGEHLAAPSDSVKIPFGSPEGSAAAFGQRSGTFNVTLVTVILSGSPNNRISDFQLDQARASIAASNKYWRAASNDRLGMQITDEYRDVTITANSTDQYYDLMAKITARMQWTATPNDAMVVYVPVSQFAGGVLGGGFMDGFNSGRVIMPVPSGFTNNVVSHEFGHVLGLNHANSLQCSNGSADVESPDGTWGDSACDSRGYGDTMDLMGLAQYTTPPINAYLWEYGGFGRGDEILDAGVVEGPRSFTLQPWAGTAARRAVKFVDPATRETYYLEFRTPVGANDGGAINNNRGVMIHKEDARGDWPDAASLALTPSSYPFTGYYNQNHAWQQGSTFRTARGTTVRIDSIGSTSASITITGTLSREAVAAPFIDGAAALVSALGVPVSEVICGLKDNGCYRNYANGAVLWSTGTGAVASVNGPTRTAWVNSGAQNGLMGYPTNREICGIRDNGCYQSFQGGEILWSAASGAQISRFGATRTAYRAAGAENGILGYPTGAEICGLREGGCYQSFQRGEILWSATTGAQISRQGGIRQVYRAAGAENGILGYPISAEICGLRDNGCSQSFQRGEILWSATTGAQISRQGGIRQVYRAAGAENGILGYPTNAEICGLRDGGCYQSFQRGEILWSATTGAQISRQGGIRNAYRAAGAENGVLGYPVNIEICGLRDNGCYQSFQNGEILWSATTNAHSTVTGPIRTTYRTQGAENGALGYPMTTQTCPTTTQCTQTFQTGTLTWTPTTGVRMVQR
ncbi:uncharacterized protein with LGFP repeats [Arthrobacter sp. CAN_A214]|uniref:hypothetical protein n=1 Tax=Arthrobacter sp. CAN_A214 TaxID=2787720 RepID=UPI0018CA4AE0